MLTNVAPLPKSEIKGQDRSLLSFNRKALLLSGIIPPENLSKSAVKKILFILYLIVCYASFIPLFIGQILAVYHFWGNMNIASLAVQALLGFLMLHLEAIDARLHSRSVVKLLEFLECNVNSRMKEMNLNENHIQIIEKAKAKARRLSIMMIVTIDITIACWIIFPFTSRYLREHNNDAVNVTTEQYEYRWLDFSYVIWAPFDITVSPYYEITYICQIVAFITTSACWKSIETTIMTLIIYTSAHLKVLETILLEMKTLLSSDNINEVSAHLTNNAGQSNIHHSVIQPGTAEPAEECLSMDSLENHVFKNEKQKLKDFIVGFVNYHETIIELVQMVNKTFGPILFMTFFIRQILGCLQLFQMAMSEAEGTFVTGLLACIAVNIPHFTFCWYGNQVIENSQLLRQAAFENSLIQQSREFKHFILMLMKNTQKPLQFSAHGFYTLSLEEFAKTVNAAYAYFNILKNIHGGNDFHKGVI